MNATVTYMPGGGFVGRADSGHWTVMDWSDGTDGAPSPVEMLRTKLNLSSWLSQITREVHPSGPIRNEAS